MSSHDVQTLANSIIGTSILAMPFCFAKCGIILSIVLLILSTIITRKCCTYLIKASIVTRRRNMELLGFYIFGHSGKTLVEISIIGFLMGTCIAFFVVIGDLCPLLIQKLFNLHDVNYNALRNWLIILITVTCIIPLSFLKNIQSLSFVCKASIGFYIILTLKTILESFSRFSSDDSWSTNIELWNPSNILQCLPIFSMAMSCQMQLFEVYENITSFDRVRQNIFHATSICFIVYSVIGFFGYVAFYNQTLSGNVLLNFTPSFSTDIITLGFILSIACSFPLVIFPCRTSLASLIYRKVHHSEISPYMPESKYKPLTIFIILSTMIVGILIPSVEVVISLVGSTIGTLICVIFPATCFVKIMQRHSTEKLVAQGIILVGFVVMILGTYSNLSALDTAKSGSHIEVRVPISTLNEPVPILHPNDIPKIQNEPPPIFKAVVEEVVKNNSDNQHKKTPKKLVDEAKISEDGINKEELEIAADKTPLEPANDPIQAIKEKDIEIKELKASKDKLEQEVMEIKQELVKQNKETQKLVLQKFDEIAEKVDKIEKQSQDVKEDNKDEAKQDVKNEPILTDAKIVPPEVTNVTNDQVLTQNEPVPVEKKPVDPIVKLIQNQEPLSYRIGEKMAEEKQQNLSALINNEFVAPQKTDELTKKEPDEKGVVAVENNKNNESDNDKKAGDKHLELDDHKVAADDNLQNKQSDDKRTFQETNEDLKNEMRKKRNVDDLESIFNTDPLNVQLKSMISRDLKSVSDET